MRRIRVIPSLLIQNGGLVKTVKFKNCKYVGDPINAVKIFNEKEVDEIVILDISATVEKRGPDIALVRDLTSEAFMPLGYGGGITKLEEIKSLIFAGVEKVILNTSAFNAPDLIAEAAKVLGSQSVVVSVDVKKNLWGKPLVYVQNGSKSTGLGPVEFAKRMQDAGAGEIILNNIDRDGTYLGYDLDLIRKVSETISIPLVALGGAADLQDFEKAINHGASAVCAGSMFVFQRPHQAVLISYPSQHDLTENLFKKVAGV